MYSNIDFDDFFREEPLALREVFSPRESKLPTELNDEVLNAANELGVDGINRCNQSDLFNPRVEQVQVLECTDDLVDGVYKGRNGVIEYLHSQSVEACRKNINIYGADLEDENLLEVSRKVRDCFPSSNEVSKRAQELEQGGEGTTYEKFDFGLKGPNLQFGTANEHHHTGLIGEPVLCVDTNSVSQGKFIKGSIESWRKYYEAATDGRQLDFVLVDVSSMDAGGFGESKKAVKAIQEMYRDGITVLAKWHLKTPTDMKLIAWKKVRPHNHEVVCMFSRDRGDRTLDFKTLLERVANSNISRNKSIFSRNCKFRFPLSTHYHVRRLEAVRPPVKQKPLTRYIFPRENRHARILFDRFCRSKKMEEFDGVFMNNVIDSGPRVGSFRFRDMFVFCKDPRVLFHSLHKYACSEGRRAVFLDEWFCISNPDEKKIKTGEELAHKIRKKSCQPGAHRGWTGCHFSSCQHVCECGKFVLGLFNGKCVECLNRVPPAWYFPSRVE